MPTNTNRSTYNFKFPFFSTKLRNEALTHVFFLWLFYLQSSQKRFSFGVVFHCCSTNLFFSWAFAVPFPFFHTATDFWIFVHDEYIWKAFKRYKIQKMKFVGQLLVVVSRQISSKVRISNFFCREKLGQKWKSREKLKKVCWKENKKFKVSMKRLPILPIFFSDLQTSRSWLGLNSNFQKKLHIFDFQKKVSPPLRGLWGCGFTPNGRLQLICLKT